MRKAGDGERFDILMTAVTYVTEQKPVSFGAVSH